MIIMGIQNTNPINNNNLIAIVNRFYEAKQVVISSSPQINEIPQNVGVGTMTAGPLVNRYDQYDTSDKNENKKETKSNFSVSYDVGHSVILSDVSVASPADMPPATSFVHGIASYENLSDILDEDES